MLTGGSHFWAANITKSLKVTVIVDTMKRFPYFAGIFRFLFSKFLTALTKDSERHEAYTMSLIER